MPVVAAAGVLGAVVFVGFSGGNDEASGISGGTEQSAVFAVDGSVLTVPGSTLLPVLIGTDPATVKTQLTSSLSKGMYGDEVKAMQQRLLDLGFQPGPIDGQFGNGTQQALWAFEGLVSNLTNTQQTGVLTNALWQTMQDDIVVQPRRTETSTTHVEIDLPKQVLVVYDQGKAIFISHISSGKLTPEGIPATFCDEVTIDTDSSGVLLAEPITKGICAESKTPGGVFDIDRKVVGHRVGALGGMDDPVYFNYGIAIHGAVNVPNEPASHGCIRIPQFLSPVFAALVTKGDQVWVWDGKKEPEQQSENDRLPSFNRPDPLYTTTTSSTTSTVVPTTTVVTTTNPAAATTTTTGTTTTTTTTSTTVVPTTTI